MAEWKKFTGSDEQLREIANADHGWLVKYTNGAKSRVCRGSIDGILGGQPIQEYFIYEHNPHIEAEIRKRAIELYKPPFHYDKKLGWIFDGEGKQVLDKIDETAVLRIRGWGRIGYLENPEQLQDMVGDLVAQALTEFWTKENK